MKTPRKLTQEQADAIRSALLGGASQASQARAYGVSTKLINHIAWGRRYSTSMSKFSFTGQTKVFSK